MTRLTTLPDSEAVAERAAREVAGRLQLAVQERGIAHLALSGGSTPGRTYGLLATRVADWTRTEVWFADERCVPEDDEESNWRMVSQTLLRSIGTSPGRVHRMEGEVGPEQGAMDYGAILGARVPRDELGRPVLDVIVLGIGPDGHVASLFPGADTLSAQDQARCLPVWDSPKPPPQRITLSLGVLRAARCCVLLATGSSKAGAVTGALGEPSREVPASLLRRDRLIVMTDEEAAPAGSGQGED